MKTIDSGKQDWHPQDDSSFATKTRHLTTVRAARLCFGSVSFALGWAVLLTSACTAQVVLQPINAGSGVATPPGPGNSDQIYDQSAVKGPHHKREVWTRQEVDRHGKPILRTYRYTTVSPNLNRWDTTTSQWIDTAPDIELVQGAAIARKTAHQVIFAANARSAAAIDLLTSDNVRLRSHVLALEYYDRASGKSVLIAQVKDSIGQLAPPNRIVYADAFDNIPADIVYENLRGAFLQSVVLKGPPPKTPSDLGMDPLTTQIEVLTEFADNPSPVIASKVLSSVTDPQKRQAMSDPDFVDQTLGFGMMSMIEGRAFGAANEGGLQPPENGIPMGKQWLVQGGRSILVEAVQYPNLKPLLDQLQANNRKRAGAVVASVKPESARFDGVDSPGRTKNADDASLMAKASRGIRALPPPFRGSNKVGSIEVASNLRPAPDGVVLDYQIIATVNQPFTFQGDTTYYLPDASWCTFGSSLTIEGGTVVKFGTESLVLSQGGITLSTSAYRPAVFTAQDDDTVGDVIQGSTGAPSGYYAHTALAISTPSPIIQYVRISHASYGIHATSPTISHSQWVHCGSATYAEPSTWNLRNVLMYNTATNFNGHEDANASMGYTINVENMTLHQCSRLAGVGDPASTPAFSHVNLTNCLLVDLTSDGSGTTASHRDNTYATTSASGPFQTVGAAAHYLASGTYRGIGNTAINAGLLADLATKTTYPPTLLPSNISTDRTLNPVAQRDDLPGTIDIGYHYDPIDWAWPTSDNYLVKTLTVGPGTVIAANSGLGVELGGGGAIVSIGLPGNFARFVYYNTVQEQANGAWSGYDLPASIESPSGSVSPVPTAYFRFTDFAMLGGSGLHVGSYNGVDMALGFADCQFRGASITSSRASCYLTNCLFERVNVALNDTGAPSGNTQNVYNNLFRLSNLNLTRANGNSAWTWRDNVFDQSGLSSSGSVTADHNGYTGGITHLGSGAGDVTLGFVAYDSPGPLGNYYQTSNSGLIGKGSRLASAAGLFHYTVFDSQQSENNAVVTIGLHYVALNNSGQPLDSNTDGTPDYLEDWNGNGIIDNGETSWTPPPLRTLNPNLKVFVGRPINGTSVP